MASSRYPWLKPDNCSYPSDEDDTSEENIALQSKRCPYDSDFYETHVRNPKCNDEHFLKEIRRYVGMSWWNYLEIIEAVKADEMFREWFQPKLLLVAPIEVMVAASLRIIRGSSPYDLYQYMCVCIPLIRKFSPLFQEFASSTLYDVYVRPTMAKKRKIPVEDDYADRVAKVMKHFAGKAYHDTR